ncbi:hypothetical protein BCR36DRAFT_334651 [Piromyces finnis]|uniref:Phosphatidic acid phosphatase type 2/haloperoxidase domain-containing protein n=1 Tax=Piromyces finnis TaxID=1754191 RepID=A0A1Y1V1B1_9FUNG|nr:hypothetical protein BCR36DRAFT_334651 [Piromyces finnis]|eukprot:ORX44300.1 hypothetical protein BCR36DRAFT_334651 [Piromyces finnis]
MVATTEINNTNKGQTVDPLTFKEKLRLYLKKGIESESNAILKLQKKIQNPILNEIMLIATFTGNDDFYTIFIPMLFSCDISGYGLIRAELFREINFLARNLVLSFAYSTFITGFVKDYLSLPRPKSPPVIRKLKKSYVDYEFGCPSTHSANACVLALNFLFFFLTFIKPVITVSNPLMIIIYFTTFLFIFMVSISRIYFGMHSFLDITVGLVIGITVTVINWYIFSYIYESFFYSSILGPIIQLIFHRFLLLYIHPEPEHYCPCFEDSYSFFCFFDGIAIGSWFDKKIYGSNSSVKTYNIKNRNIHSLKSALMNEPIGYKNIKSSFLRYEFLNKLYNIFGIKSVLLIRYVLGLIILLCFKKVIRKTILFIANRFKKENKNIKDKSKSDLNQVKDDTEDEDILLNHKKKYHLPRHSVIFLSRNFEYIGLGFLLYANIHLFEYLKI